MSVAITTTNVWPASLPLPFLDYTGAAQVPTIISPASSARTRRRSRWTTVYATLEVTWNFTRSQFTTFLAFWSTSLGNGVARFELELRYPRNSALDTWIVQFVGDIEITAIENSLQQVRTTMQILTKATLPDAAALLS